MKIINRVSYYFHIISIAVLLVMMFLTAFDVIGRASFNSPIKGTYELMGYMLSIFVLTGIAYTQQQKANVSVPLLVAKLPLRVQKIIRLIFYLLILAFFALLISPAWTEGMYALRAGRHSDMLHIPAYPFKIFICVGIALLCLELLVDLITMFKGQKTPSISRSHS